MFLNAPLNASPVKMKIYLVASTVLGILLGFIVYAIAVTKYLNWVVAQGSATSLSSISNVLLGIAVVVLAAGAVGGFFVGRFWWRKVYVERVWAKRIRKRT